MKYLSLFSGIGGFELGIQQAYESLCNKKIRRQRKAEDLSVKSNRNIISKSNVRQSADCIGYSENNKYAIQIYEKHFNHKNYGDITTIKPKELPDFDLLVGGFPCQSFSIAGKRGGFNDTRGTLFFDIARILTDKKPKHLVLENVKGLLSHDGGRTFQTIIGVLTDLGYFIEWQVLNSKNFGVPQNRERVFIIGHLRGTGGRKVFPIQGSDQENNEGEQSEVTQCLTSNYYKTPNAGNYLKQIVGGSQGNRVYNPKGLATTIASQAGGQGAKTGLYAMLVLTPDRPNKRQNGRRIKNDGDPSFTLTAQDKHGVMIGSTQKNAARMKNCSPALTEAMGKGGGHVPMQLKGSRIRRLTPTECERLQGFPDGWTEGISDTQRYKCLGNAVTVNVIKAIFNKLNA